MRSIVVFILLLFFVNLQVIAQTSVPFNSPRWKFKTVENAKDPESTEEIHLGQPSLKLRGRIALLEDADFGNGIIEFDIALKQARYFPGIEFRMRDEKNYEQYYLRPHQSGNPDAMQYMPVFNDMGAWQLYYGQGFNNAVRLPFDRWLHIKIVVSGKQAEVYFDKDAEPVLFINLLKTGISSGMLALENSYNETAWFSNFTYTRSNDVGLKGKPTPAPVLQPGTIRLWQVSSPLDENRVKDKPWPSSADTSTLQWQPLQADELGIANLSQLWPVKPNSNTVFMRKVIMADKAGIQKLTFGFSDRIRVYCNNRLLYTGNDEFMSRDYRFLGTVGYFDAVYLDLKKGRNELWLAVSEDFGGWGVKAMLEPI